jgi:hypothetical protein
VKSHHEDIRYSFQKKKSTGIGSDLIVSRPAGMRPVGDEEYGCLCRRILSGSKLRLKEEISKIYS